MTNQERRIELLEAVAEAAENVKRFASTNNYMALDLALAALRKTYERSTCDTSNVSRPSLD